MYLTGWYFRLRFWGPSPPETPRELARRLNDRCNRPNNIVALVNNNAGKLSSENNVLGIKSGLKVCSKGHRRVKGHVESIREFQYYHNGDTSATNQRGVLNLVYTWRN